jgi:hypothetical protein
MGCLKLSYIGVDVVFSFFSSKRSFSVNKNSACKLSNFALVQIMNKTIFLLKNSSLMPLSIRL